MADLSFAIGARRDHQIVCQKFDPIEFCTFPKTGKAKRTAPVQSWLSIGILTTYIHSKCRICCLLVPARFEMQFLFQLSRLGKVIAPWTDRINFMDFRTEK